MARCIFSKDVKFNWKNYPLLYIYIFQFLAEKVGKFDQEVHTKIILETWHRHIYHVPRLYDSFFLEELQYFGFISKYKAQRYLFKGSMIANAMERLGNEVKETKEPLEAPLLYVYVFSKMMDVFGRKNQILTSKQLLYVWRKFIPNVPRVHDQSILMEMCNYGLIRKINTQKFIFYGGKIASVRKMNNLRLW